MERTLALKKLEKLLGKKLGWRINPKAPGPDERANARAALSLAIEERNKLKEQRDARHRAILEGDAEYQRLKDATRAAIDRVENLSSITRHFKITVGVTGGPFFIVKAEGDSWEEILAKLASEKKAEA